MRSLAALIVLVLMMLIAAIWVRCGLALAGLGPPLDDAMLFGCSWGSFSIFVVVQLLPGVSSCVCEPDVCLHFCFPGSSGAFDTMKDLVGLFICSCVCGCLHALDMQVPVSSGAFEFSYVLALFYSGRRVGQSSCALLGCGFCTWTAKVAFCEFVLLAACFAFVATVSGLEGPTGGNSFQPFDAMLAALLFSGMELVGHFTLFSGIELVGHFAQFPGICFEGRFKQFGWKRPVGQFRKGMQKYEERVALSVSLVSSKVFFPGFCVWDPGGEFCGACAAPSLDGETQALHQFQRRQECRRCGDCASGQSSSRISRYQQLCPFRSLGSATQGPACPVFRQREGRFVNVCCQRVSGGGPVASRWHGWSGCVCHDEREDIGLAFRIIYRLV